MHTSSLLHPDRLRFANTRHELYRSTRATLLPVDLVECRKVLDLGEVTDHDDEIEGLIPDAVEQVEDDARITLLTTTWKLVLDFFPVEIELRVPPIASVTNIVYVDIAGDSQTLDSSLYQTDLTGKPGRIIPAYNETWPETRYQLNAVTVTFVAGETAATSLPPMAKRAVLLALRSMWHKVEPSEAYRSLIGRLRWGSYA